MKSQADTIIIFRILISALIPSRHKNSLILIINMFSAVINVPSFLPMQCSFPISASGRKSGEGAASGQFSFLLPSVSNASCPHFRVGVKVEGVRERKTLVG